MLTNILLMIFIVLWLIGMIIILATRMELKSMHDHIIKNYDKITKQLASENELLRNIRGQRNNQKELIKNTRMPNNVQR